MKFTDPSTHPVVLLSVLTQRYGAEWMEWEPSVLRMTLERDEGSNPSRAVLNKALAAAALATRDEFWHHHEHFHFLVQAINGVSPVVGEMQEHTLAEMMIAAWIARHIREELKSLSHMPEYSEDVSRYVAGHAKNNGVWYLKDTPLEFAHSFAVGKWYHCKDCNHDREVLFPDGLCDFCVDRWNPEHLGSWNANSTLVRQGKGKNIEFYFKNPGEPVMKRLQELEARPGVGLGENQVDICVDRYLSAKRSLNENISRMKTATIERAA